MQGEWHSKSHQMVYTDANLTLWSDAVAMSGDQETHYSYVERQPGVMIIPVTEEGQYHLVRQYRYPVRSESWEFPAGTLHEEEAPLDAARRELAEEIGLRFDEWVELGQISTSAGLTTQKCTVYRVTGLHPVEQKRDATEADMVVQTFSLTEVEAMVRTGKIHDAMTLAALARVHLAP